MKTNDKKYIQTMKNRLRSGRWLRFLMQRINPQREHFSALRPTSNRGNAPPPIVRRWSVTRYGLWRMDGKPVPIRTAWFRRT